MTTPFRVAVLTPSPTHPTDFGNRKRIHRVCELLQDRGAVIDLFLYALEDDWRGGYPRGALEEMRRQWDDVHLIVPSVPYHPPPEGDDHRIDEWWDPAIETYLRWYLRNRRPDALLVNYAYLSKALELAPPGCLRLLDTHDRLSGRREVLDRLGLRPEFFYTTPEEEAKALDRADLVLAIKREEAVYFESLSETPAIAFPFVGQVQETPRAPDPDGYLRVGLLGARNNVNASSTRRFLSRALPRFRDHIAPIRVVLAGSMCQDLQGYRANDAVTLLGYLDDVADFYRQVDVAVVPVEISTGQKIRVGEALAHGVPVIAHAHAFEGYPDRHPYHRLPDLDAIADACIDLSFEPSRLGELEAASHAAQAAGDRQVELAADFVAGAIRSNVPVSWFVVPNARLEDEPELRLHLASMVSLAASYSRVRVVITDREADARVRRPIRKLETLLTRFASIRDVADDDGLYEALDMPETAAVWCYDEAALPTVVRLRHDVVVARGFAPEPPLARPIESGLLATQGAIFVGRLEGEVPDLRLAVRTAFPLRPVADRVASELNELSGTRRSHRVLVLADPPSSPLVAVAVASIRRAAMSAVLVTPQGTVDITGLGLADEEDPDLQVMSAAEAREWLRTSSPARTIDCTLGAASMVPALALSRLYAARGDGATPWNVTSLAGKDSLRAVAAAIRAYLVAPEPAEPPAARTFDDGARHFRDHMSHELPRPQIDVSSLAG